MTGNPMEIAIFYAGASEDSSVREAIAQFEHTQLAWEVSTPMSLWERLAHRAPGVLLFGLDPNHDEAIDLLAQITSRFASIKVIAFSADHAPDLIISAMRHGCAQFALHPIDAKDLWQAIQRVAAGSSSPRASGRRIALVGAAGGCGATAIACNLATEIAMLSGKETALVDFNLDFGDVADNFDAQPRHTIADLIGHDDIDASLLKHAMDHLDNGVWLLGRPNRIDDAFAVSPELISRVLHLLPTVFEASVVDAARRFDAVGMAALENCDVVLIVMQLLVPHIRNGSRLYEALRAWGINMDQVHPLINRRQKGKERIETMHVEKLFGKRVIAELPNDYRAVSASLEFGRPMMSEHANSAVRLAIRDLASRLMQPDITVPIEREEVVARGLLKRIFH